MTMFQPISEPLLIEKQFEKVYMKRNDNVYSTYYYKQGFYVKFFFEGYYDVYNNEMELIATVNNLYHLEILLVAKSYPLQMN